MFFPLGVQGRLVPEVMEPVFVLQLRTLLVDAFSFALPQLLHTRARLGERVLKALPCVCARHYLAVVVLRLLLVPPLSWLGLHYVADLRHNVRQPAVWLLKVARL